MEKFPPQPPARPKVSKEKLGRAKEAVILKLLAKYESIVVEAKQHKKEARGLALLEQAEKELEKMQKVKNAKTLAEISEFQEPDESLEQEGFGFSREQLAALDEVFGENNLKRVILSDPKELTPEYFDREFPKEQRMVELNIGLVSFRRYWEREAREEFPGFKNGTVGQAIMSSMKREAEKLREKGIDLYAESIQKPNPKSGTQRYGTVEGIESGYDGLDRIMRRCFGNGANRFGHSYDELNESFDDEAEKKEFIDQRQIEYEIFDRGKYEFKRQTLESPLELIRQEIRRVFKEKGLTLPPFKIMLEPALVFNRQTTDQVPGNSRTYTEEITSTPLLTEAGRLSGFYFKVGDREKGGASQVEIESQGSRSLKRGFRIAILLLKQKAK